MDKREAGKERAVQFVTEVARGQKQGSSTEFLWWSADPPRPARTGWAGATTVTLRMYKGNSWRLVEFAASDIDGSVDDPAVLTKYEGEVAQSLAEL